ncbi:hypothetical protein ABZ707_02990 [Streptomyces sp. NPDC006923]|uniref:DUF7620 family protein n=1 Tax=Streptomyces sp. NPDC006923 TaxID=3155355 RepID=UPI0033E9C907
MPRWTRFLPHRHEPRTRPETDGQRDADSAPHRAEQARRETKQRRPDVSDAEAKLRRLREHNHFAEMIDLALSGEK